MKGNIEGIETVYEAVGFETTFHDSEILSIELDRTEGEPILTISILTRRSSWDSGGKGAEPPSFVVRIQFFDINDVELQGFNHQNVIQSVVIENDQAVQKIRFAGLFGADCGFTYSKGKVLSVKRTDMKLGHPFRSRNNRDA